MDHSTFNSRQLKEPWTTHGRVQFSGKKKCVLSYGICDVTHFLFSEDQETRVQNDQQEQGYNLRDPQDNLRNKHLSSPEGGQKSAFYHTGFAM